MAQTVIIAFLDNAAILLALSVVLNVTYLVPARYRRMQPVFSGLMISLICLAVMKMPFTLRPGVIYDSRSILISVTALMFGPIPTAITVTVAAVLRLSIGGAGTMSGLAVIFTSALIGLAWRRRLYPKSAKQGWLNVLFMSITVHVTMLACMLLIPYPDNLAVIREIAVPLMVIYPVASTLLCLLLVRQQEYKNVQDQLKQSEERFKSLFDKAPLGYQSLDENGVFIEVNQQWCDLLGYSRDEVIGKWFGDFLPAADREAFRRRFPIFKAQGHIQSQFEVLSKSGKPMFISFEGKIAYGMDGAFKQTHCILQDITQQKQAEDQLRLGEEKYRRLFETMAQGVVYQDAYGAIISANPAAERILGLSFEQMQGKTSTDLIWRTIKEDGSALPGSEHPSMIALQTGKSFGPYILGVYQSKTDDYVWLSVTAVPLFHPGETNPFQVYTTFQDITAERKANQNYQSLFTEMVDAFALHEIICDDQGKPVDYRFLTVNPAFERVIGLKAADILGKTVMEVLPNTEPYWINMYGKVALTGEPIRFENYTVSSDKYFEVSAYQAAPNQFACTFTDITKRVRAEAETKRILSRLRSLLDNSPSPIVIIDDLGRLIEVSAAAKKIMGLSNEDSAGKATSKIAPPAIMEKVSCVLSQSSNEDRFPDSIDVFELEGNKRYFESRIFPIHDPNQYEKLFGYLAIDITERILAEQALKEAKEKYSSYIQNAPYAVFVVNEYGQYLEANQSASVITGYSEEQLLKMSIKDITTEESMASALRHFGELKATGSMSVELQYLHNNGSIRWWVVDAVKISDSRYLGFSSDITEKKAAEADLLYLSNHDFLTGLYNRRFFASALKRFNAVDHLPLSIIMGDINGVKLVNDALGHAEGDRLIIDCAKIISGCCPSTAILARIGGDEFAVLMPETDSTAAKGIMENIQSALSAYDRHTSNDKFRHSVSLGFGTKRTIDEDVEQVMKIAEEYMYQRKLLEHNNSHSAIIAAIKATMNEKSQDTEAHAERLVALSRQAAIGLNLSQNDQDRLELLATLHDIGKVGISDRILTKQGKLTEEEWVEMKRHPEIGYRIAMSSPDLMPVAESILCHHERWDGSGYPRGLCGENIPLLSRILAVADAYDAMTQDRPYRKAMSHEEAVAEIERYSGRQFDPRIARIFMEKFNEATV